MRQIVFFILFFLVGNILFAQVIASDDIVLCDGQQGSTSVTLTATSFAVDLTDSNIYSDDTFGGIVDMGFNFVFYGNTYNQVVLASNNYLSFNTANANGYSDYTIGAAIPTNLEPETQNGILCPWQDIYPGVNGNGTIQYATIGEAPNRVFIASFCGIPMFSCTDICYSSQIKLFETTNIIETHIAQKVLCTTWNGGNAIHGLHNIDGTIAHVVTGLDGIVRNYPNQWTCENDGWRFTPNGDDDYILESIEFSPAVAGTDIIWQDQFGNQVGTGGEITVLPGGDVTYTAGASLCGTAGDWCGFAGGIEGDDVNITFEELVLIGESTDVVCYNFSNGTITAIAPSDGEWEYNLYMEEDLLASQISIGDNFVFEGLSPGNYSVTITENDTGCISEELIFNLVEPAEISALTTISDAACNANDGMINISISGGTPAYNTVLGDVDGQVLSTQTGSQVLFDNLGSGDYFFSVFDTNGCLVVGDEVFFTIGVDGVDVTDAQTQSDQEVCDTQIILSANAPIDGEIGFWSILAGQGDIEMPNEPETMVTNLGLGENTFVWTLENECGTSTDEIIINTISGIPTISDPGELFCMEEVQLSVSIQSQEGEWSVSPSEGVFISDPTSLNTTAILPEYGSYTFSFEGCNGGLDSQIITMETISPILLAPTEVYCLEEFELSAEVLGDPGYWDFEGPGNVIFEDINSENTAVSVDAYGEYEFTYFGCGSSSSITVMMESINPVVSGPDEVSCLEEFELSAEVSGDPGYWSFEGPGNAIFDDINSENTAVNVDAYGEYEFTYYGCNKDVSIEVDMVITQPTIQNPGIIYCEDESSVTVNSVFSGSWDILNAPEGENIIIEVIDDMSVNVTVSNYGQYEIMFTDECGFSDSTVLVFSTAEASIIADDHQYCVYTVHLSAITPSNSQGYWDVISWPTGVSHDEIDIIDSQSSATQAVVPDFGVYIFEYQYCDEQSSVEVGVSCPMSVPNSFSPNGDGVNDLFQIPDLNPNVYSQSMLYIYNKWGSVIYVGPNYGLNGTWWDGQITYVNKQKSSITPARLFNENNSGYVTDGVYYYTLEVYNMAVNQKEFYSGDINIFSNK